MSTSPPEDSPQEPDALLGRFIDRYRSEHPKADKEFVELGAGILKNGFLIRVANHRTMYHREGMGLSIWRLIRECHQQGEQLPSDIVAKLAEWGERLELADNPREMAKALELVGNAKAYKGGSKRLNGIEREGRLATQVAIMKRTFNLKDAPAIERVARNERQPPWKVRKAFYDFFGRKPAKSAYSLDDAMKLLTR